MGSYSNSSYSADPIEPEEPKTPTFQEELRALINKHSLENGSNTPDFILAAFLENVLTDFNHALSARHKWLNPANPRMD